MATPGFKVSRSRIARIMVKVEPSPGTDAVCAGGTDDILVFDSAIIWSMTAQSFTFIPNKASFTQRKDTITERIAQLRFKLRMNGPGAASDYASPILKNGFKGLDACLQACAMMPTTTASTSIVYSPSTIDYLKTVTVLVEHHGQTHKVTGATGNVVITGNPRTGLEAAFTMTGVYNAPTLTVAGDFSNYNGGAGTALPMLGINLQIDNGTGLYIPVAQSFQFDRGVAIEQIENMNDASGLEATIVGDAAPKMQVVIKQDNNPDAEITYAQFFSNMLDPAPTTHAIQFTLGTTAGNIISFQAPQAQLIPGTGPQANGMHRELSLSYKVQSDNEDDEFSWSFT